MNEANCTIKIKLTEEGLNNINVNIKENDTYLCKWVNDVYYVEPYKTQFLEELNQEGISTHMGYPWYTDDPSQISILKATGASYIRDDIRWNIIENSDGSYNYTKYDNWINEAYENNVDIIGILGYGSTTFMGSDSKISSEKELQHFLQFVENFATRYKGKIMYYEYWNEPNTILNTEDDVYWYIETVERLYPLLKSIDEDITLVIGAMRTDGAASDSFKTSNEIFDIFYKNSLDQFSDVFSIHIYDYRKDDLNNIYNRLIKEHVDLFNDYGGFQNYFVTERGVSTFQGEGGASEEKQTSIAVTQSVINDQYDAGIDILYMLRNRPTSTANSETIASYNFGLLREDYTPKPAYYAMKNYYENTNGAEYIGTVDLGDGIDAHVYNKDGKPKIIAWSNNADETVTIDYKGFTAKDTYGNDIANTNGKLEITLSPVYLDDVSKNYFYQAISNTALEKYAEFETEFETEISNIEGLQEEINELKQYMKSIASISNVSQSTASQKMKEHFNLGNLVLKVFRNEKLNIEYLRLSSMLDKLDDIGDSYEDLVTVSSTTINSNLGETKTLIDTVELNLKNNSDLEMKYPTKIIKCSEDLYEESEYINSLTEKNDIKTGLIVSKDLHAKYLAEWANTFIDVYIDEYIENNPLTVSYSETKLTNKDVIVTLKGNNIKITNNQGKNTYTFTKNGTFIFEYTIRGRNLKITVNVDNIDKEAPIVRNIENNQIIYTNILPNIVDENLNTITLKKDGKVISYTRGERLFDLGLYELRITDKAGNQINIVFRLAEEPEYNYTVKDKNITNVKVGTTKAQFIKNYIIIEDYKVFHNDTELKDDDTVSTGDTVKLSNGDIHTIIVAGDINKDGKITVYDYTMLRNYILRIDDFDNVEMLAADANCDNKVVGVSDYTKIREVILGIS